MVCLQLAAIHVGTPVSEHWRDRGAAIAKRIQARCLRTGQRIPLTRVTAESSSTHAPHDRGGVYVKRWRDGMMPERSSLVP